MSTYAGYIRTTFPVSPPFNIMEVSDKRMHNSAFYKSRWTAGQRISIFSNDLKLGSCGYLELYHNRALVLSFHP
jgi:hypothetical protein